MAKEVRQKPSFNIVYALTPSPKSLEIYAKIVLLVFFSLFLNAYGARLSELILIPTIFHLGIVYLALSIFFDSVTHLVNFFYRSKNRRPATYEDSFTIGISRVSRVIFFFAFVLSIVDVFIPIGTLLGSLTIAIAITGLAFRDFITNFVSGVSIMFSRKFELNEYVKIGEYKGRIRDITFTHVHLQTESQDVVYVPNNVMLAKEVINFSKSKTKNVLVRIVIDKAQFSQYAELRELIISKVPAHFPDSMSDAESVKIRVESLEKETVVWLIEYRVSRYDFALETALKNFTAELLVDFSNRSDLEEAESNK